MAIFDWHIKEKEVDDDSEYRYYPTYKIPIAFAKVDCNKYFKEPNYAIYKYINKGNKKKQVKQGRSKEASEIYNTSRWKNIDSPI